MDDRNCILGEIQNCAMKLSEPGIIVQKCWVGLKDHFQNIKMDYYIIMPNHIHGIIFIKNKMVLKKNMELTNNDGLNDKRVGLMNQTPTNPNNTVDGISWVLMRNKKPKLGKILRHFKAISAKLIHDSGFRDFKWQRNYYDHITRSEKELDRIRQYIINNPLKWDLDRGNHLSENYEMNCDMYFRDVYDS